MFFRLVVIHSGGSRTLFGGGGVLNSSLLRHCNGAAFGYAVTIDTDIAGGGGLKHPCPPPVYAPLVIRCYSKVISNIELQANKEVMQY